MGNEIIKSRFLDAAEEWICDGYSLDIRYLAKVEQSNRRIWSALIDLRPLPAPKDLSFRIDSSFFAVGQLQKSNESKKSLLHVLSHATSGAIDLPEGALTLPGEQAHDFYSEMLDRERWFGELHLQVSEGAQPVASAMELGKIDNILRSSQPPFDGLNDAAAWLGVSAHSESTNRSSIAMRVGPPVDLFQGSLSKDILTLTLHAHHKFDVSRVGLAVRAVPGNFLDTRKQVADHIKWKRVREGRRSGVAKIPLEQADNVLTMLMIGDSTVRRQWFIDPTKARNNRLLAVQHFDADLKMVREAVLETSDSKRFEHGIAALLFVLGFSPSVQIETDAPDLIVSTPIGKLVIVECTTRIADFAAKVGRLVDRRGALTKYLTASGHPADIAAVLICRLPRDQIAVHEAELRSAKIILLARGDLEEGLNRVRVFNDPDRILDDALAALARPAMPGR